MMNHEHPDVDLTVEGDHGEPAAQRARVEEPDHLLCPITREMFRDPVVLVESGHTYEREAIEQHLRRSQIDPRSNVRIGSKRLIANISMRMTVEAWLEDNPGVTPDGWTSRGMLPLKYPDSNSNGTCEYNAADAVVLCRWRESCPELRDLWRGNDPGRWKGVTWSDGRVTELNLREEELSGQLPRLEGLTSLQEVDLDSNQLTGSIPEKLFEGLTSLREVGLGCNQLSGPIPEKLFEGLTALQEVNLRYNQLSGPIPDKLFKGLTSLQSVSLFYNQLTGPIPEKLFEGLTSLRRVSIGHSQLTGPIPEKLFEGLTSLQMVVIICNQLSGPIPDKLFKGLTSLEEVSLFRNQLTGPIPEKLFEGLTSLRKVSLNHNYLRGELSRRLFQGLISLQRVDLEGNSFDFHDLSRLPIELQRIIDLLKGP